MLVKNWMSKQVITIDANDSMNNAIHLLKKHNIMITIDNSKTLTPEKQAMISSADALELLKAGNERFLNKRYFNPIDEFIDKNMVPDL